MGPRLGSPRVLRSLGSGLPALILALLPGMIGCADHGGLAGGGGVETTGGELVAMAGSAAGARVRLVPSDWRPAPGEAFPDSLTTLADDKGRWTLEDVPPGAYNLEAFLPRDGSRLFRGGITIAKGDNTLATDSLRAPGSLRLHWPAARPGILYLPGTTVAAAIRDAESLPAEYVLDSLPAGRLPPVHHRAGPDSAPAVLTDSLVIVSGDTARREVLEGWTRHARLRINTSATGADIPAAVADFPLLLRLYQGDIEFSEAAGDGRDLRFTDAAGALLPHALDRWDPAAGAAVIWIRVPRIEGGTDTNTLFMHWGNRKAPPPAAGPVFDRAGGFEAVWHLDEPGNTSPGGYRDAAGSHPGTASALIDTSRTEGLIWGGLKLDGSKHVGVGPGPGLDSLTQITVSAWFKADLWTGGDRHIIQKGSVAGQFGIGDVTGSDSLEFRLPIDSRNRGIRIPAPSIGEMHLVHATFDGTYARLYLDGEMKRNETITGAMGTSGDSLFIGHRPGGVDTDHFQGLLDEVTVSRVARPPHWIKLAYATQKHLAKVVTLEILK